MYTPTVNSRRPRNAASTTASSTSRSDGAGALLPDVEQHLLVCRHCRHAAEQLSHFEGELGVLLAEAVLGWGARRYPHSRPGRSGPGAYPRGQAGRGGGRPGGGGRHRLMARMPLPDERFNRPKGRTRAVVVGVGVLSFALLASVIGLRDRSDTSSIPKADWGAVSGYTTGPAAASPSAGQQSVSSSPPAGDSASAGPAGYPGVTERGRLRHLATGLCLDIRGGRVVAGAGTGLAVCSSAATQQWSYEDDGLLRSLADPGLCLDSHSAAGEVFLSGCVGSRADEIRYDLTVQGELLPHWREELVVAPVSLRAGAGVVVRTRSGAVGRNGPSTPTPPRPTTPPGRTTGRRTSGRRATRAPRTPRAGSPTRRTRRSRRGRVLRAVRSTRPSPVRGTGLRAPPGRPHPHPRSRPRPTPVPASSSRRGSSWTTAARSPRLPPATALPPQPLTAARPVVATVAQGVGSLTGIVGSLPSR